VQFKASCSIEPDLPIRDCHSDDLRRLSQKIPSFMATQPLGKDMLPWMNHMPTSNLTVLARIEKSGDGG
jgi:hypothetical protein